MEPKPSQQALAETVAAALQVAGLVQRDVAEGTGIPLATLNRRLTGRSPFLITELAAIAELLDTTASGLLSLAESGAAA